MCVDVWMCGCILDGNEWNEEECTDEGIKVNVYIVTDMYVCRKVENDEGERNGKR